MENIKEERSLRSRGRPKGKPTHGVKVPEDMWAEVEEYREKKQLDTWPEAMPLYYSTKDSYKAPLVVRTEKIERKFRTEYERQRNILIESHVEQRTTLENDMKALNSKVIEKDSEIGKLKWQLKANADIARAEIVQKDAEITEKNSEIAKLKAEIEKGPSPEIMKEHSEMKETIQCLELKLNEARKGKTESPSLYDDEWVARILAVRQHERTNEKKTI
ncbi:hypothetical protein MUP46_04605 [Patescibacteria group bacterium]|nr:hypothetical protein [Patescibacteria group bacterium]